MMHTSVIHEHEAMHPCPCSLHSSDLRSCSLLQRRSAIRSCALSGCNRHDVTTAYSAAASTTFASWRKRPCEEADRLDTASSPGKRFSEQPLVGRHECVCRRTQQAGPRLGVEEVAPAAVGIPVGLTAPRHLLCGKTWVKIINLHFLFI